MKYIDTHAHYNHRFFNSDRQKIISKNLSENTEYIIECGTDEKFNDKVLQLINEHKNMFGTIGFFPTNTNELEDENVKEKFISQLSHKKIVGIGEIGLDYYHKGNPAQQKKWFVEQLKIAKRFGLPVCIHSRNAEKDTLDILKNNGQMTGVIHCYSYGVKTMQELVKLGYYFGVGGTCTYANNIAVRDAIRKMPIERIVLETDCPYLTPTNAFGNRNDSSNIKHVVNEIAKLKKMSPEEVIRITNENVKRLYPKMFR